MKESINPNGRTSTDNDKRRNRLTKATTYFDDVVGNLIFAIADMDKTISDYYVDNSDYDYLNNLKNVIVTRLSELKKILADENGIKSQLLDSSYNQEKLGNCYDIMCNSIDDAIKKAKQLSINTNANSTTSGKSDLYLKLKIKLSAFCDYNLNEYMIVEAPLQHDKPDKIITELQEKIKDTHKLLANDIKFLKCNYIVWK